MTNNSIHSSNFVSRIEIPYTVIINVSTDNIAEVEWHSSILEIEKSHLERLRNTIKEIGGGKKMLIYIDTYNFMSMTSEARAFASNEDSNKYTMANAVLIDSLAKKLLFNFYMNISKPKVPTKGFSTKTEALNWLKKFTYNF